MIQNEAAAQRAVAADQSQSDKAYDALPDADRAAWDKSVDSCDEGVGFAEAWHPSLGGVAKAVGPWIVSDELRLRVEPLLPKVERRFRCPGRSGCLIGRPVRGFVVLYTGIAWRHFAGRARLRRRLDMSPAHG